MLINGDEEPLTEEEESAIKESRQNYLDGDVIDFDEFGAELYDEK